MFWTFFGRTELILGASKAKYCEELDFEVRFHVAPQNLDKITDKSGFPRPKQFRTKRFGRRKIKCWGSSGTRFAEV